jgi:hypothetical protein
MLVSWFVHSARPVERPAWFLPHRRQNPAIFLPIFKVSKPDETCKGVKAGKIYLCFLPALDSPSPAKRKGQSAGFGSAVYL